MSDRRKGFVKMTLNYLADHVHDEKDAYQLLEELRWPAPPSVPSGHDKAYYPNAALRRVRRLRRGGKTFVGGHESVDHSSHEYVRSSCQRCAIGGSRVSGS